MAGGYMDTVLYEINTGGWNYKGNSNAVSGILQKIMASIQKVLG